MSDCSLETLQSQTGSASLHVRKLLLELLRQVPRLQHVASALSGLCSYRVSELQLCAADRHWNQSSREMPPSALVSKVIHSLARTQTRPWKLYWCSCCRHTGIPLPRGAGCCSCPSPKEGLVCSCCFPSLLSASRFHRTAPQRTVLQLREEGPEVRPANFLSTGGLWPRGDFAPSTRHDIGTGI